LDGGDEYSQQVEYTFDTWRHTYKDESGRRKSAERQWITERSRKGR
jgi:hypothetical protein